MRKIILFSLFAVVSAFADLATLAGQQITGSGQPVFGSSTVRYIYVLDAKYMTSVSATSTRSNLDTTLAATTPVSSIGATSLTSIATQSGTAISQQSSCELSYRIRATDASQAGIVFTAYGQYKTPWVDTDTNWTAQSYIWGQDTVLLKHAPPGVTTSFTTRRWSFFPSGDNFRLNITRTNVGSGDTVVITGLGLRCR